MSVSVGKDKRLFKIHIVVQGAKCKVKVGSVTTDNDKTSSAEKIRPEAMELCHQYMACVGKKAMKYVISKNFYGMNCNDNIQKQDYSV